MTKIFVKDIEKNLIEEKERLENELSQLGVHDEVGNSEDENASEVEKMSNDMSVKNELEDGLRDVISALSKIKEGTYGICKYCGKEIDQRRLEARPTSASCIECKKTFTQEV